MRISDIYMMLHQVRKERDLPQREIAEQLNVEQATVSLYENGKRAIPLELLDRWLNLFEIEVKITQKEHQPVKGEEETKSDLEVFNNLKRKRNYLIAELRSVMAIQIARTPEFQKVDEESGDSVFWTYSFYGEPCVGVVETRYDHPKQKHLAVEYTDREVNVYSANRFVGANEVFEGQEDIAWLKTGRSYFSEDDFLTLGGQWNREEMKRRKITVLRKGTGTKGEMEIVNTEGFSLRSLLDMQDHHEKLETVIRETRSMEEYKQMESQLRDANQRLLELTMENRLANGAFNPQFAMWDEQDREAIDVPLWSAERNWFWVEDGVAWEEEVQDALEIQLVGEDEEQELFYTHRHENGNRVVGLAGPDKKPAIFKSNPHRQNVIYRVEVEENDLEEEELVDYRAVLNATIDLEKLREGEERVEEEETSSAEEE